LGKNEETEERQRQRIEKIERSEENIGEIWGKARKLKRDRDRE
jgi:hypothetical protein